MPSTTLPRRLAARGHWSLALVTAVYLITLGFVPRPVLWSVDNANRYLQAAALARSDFGEYAIPWPGRAMDPHFTMNPLRFNPEGTFQELKDGQLISSFQPAFIVISAAAYRLLGVWGLHLLPLGGAIALLAAVARLATGLGGGPRAAHAAVLVTGLATPVWFYSLTFWEHTTAAALAVWGVVFLVRFLESRAGRHLAGGCALLAASVFFRDVLGLFAAVLLALLLARCPGRRRRIVLTASVVLGTGALLLFAFQGLLTGKPLGFHAGTLAGGQAGPGDHLGQRPLLFYLYFVAAHPDRALSFLLAAPFLAAFLLRPRPALARLAKVVPLWSLAAAAAAVAYLAGFLAAPSPLQRLLLANSFFLAAPVVILGLLRVKEGRHPGADLVLSAVWVYFVIYCLVAPWAGAVSLHWGGRMQFTLYPLLATLAAATLVRWWEAPGRRSVRTRAIVAALVLVSCAGQVYALDLLRQKLGFGERLARTLERLPPVPVVTNVWWAGHEMHATFFERPIFYVRTQRQLDGLAATLRARGVDEVVFAGAAQPGAPPRDALRVDDGWGFYRLDLLAMDLDEGEGR